MRCASHQFPGLSIRVSLHPGSRLPPSSARRGGQSSTPRVPNNQNSFILQCLRNAILPNLLTRTGPIIPMDAVATQTPIMPPMTALSCESSDPKEVTPDTVRTYCRWTRARVDGIAAMKPISLPEYITAKGMNSPMARFLSMRCASCRSCNTVGVASGSAGFSSFLFLSSDCWSHCDSSNPGSKLATFTVDVHLPHKPARGAEQLRGDAPIKNEAIASAAPGT